MTHIQAFCHICGNYIGCIEYTQMYYGADLMHTLCDKCFKEKGLKMAKPNVAVMTYT